MQAMTNLIGDQLDTTTNGIVATYPHVEGEKNQRRAISRKASTTVIGSASRERDYPGFVTGSWQSIRAPTGNPEPVVN